MHDHLADCLPYPSNGALLHAVHRDVERLVLLLSPTLQSGYANPSGYPRKSLRLLVRPQKAPMRRVKGVTALPVIRFISFCVAWLATNSFGERKLRQQNCGAWLNLWLGPSDAQALPQLLPLERCVCVCVHNPCSFPWGKLKSCEDYMSCSLHPSLVKFMEILFPASYGEVLKNLTNKPFPDVLGPCGIVTYRDLISLDHETSARVLRRPHTWQLLSVLCRCQWKSRNGDRMEIYQIYGDLLIIFSIIFFLWFSMCFPFELLHDCNKLYKLRIVGAPPVSNPTGIPPTS